MKLIFLAVVILLPAGDFAAESYHPVQAHWSGAADTRIPLPVAGVCFGSYEAWRADKKHALVCVRRA